MKKRLPKNGVRAEVWSKRVQARLEIADQIVRIFSDERAKEILLREKLWMAYIDAQRGIDSPKPPVKKARGK